MANYCDVLSPMIYPSHFFGMDNIASPGDEPAHFIGESMDRFRSHHQRQRRGSSAPGCKPSTGTPKPTRPSTLRFRWKPPRQRGIGFLFWNAANDYSNPFVAMPEMKVANAKEKRQILPRRRAPEAKAQDRSKYSRWRH